MDTDEGAIESFHIDGVSVLSRLNLEKNVRARQARETLPYNEVAVLSGCLGFNCNKL